MNDEELENLHFRAVGAKESPTAQFAPASPHAGRLPEARPATAGDAPPEATQEFAGAPLIPPPEAQPAALPPLANVPLRRPTAQFAPLPPEATPLPHALPMPPPETPAAEASTSAMSMAHSPAQGQWTHLPGEQHTPEIKPLPAASEKQEEASSHGSAGGSSGEVTDVFKLADLAQTMKDMVSELKKWNQAHAGGSQAEGKKPGPQGDGSFVPGGPGGLVGGSGVPRRGKSGAYPASRDQAGPGEHQRVVAAYRR
jgi:hypothetical protein